MKVFHCPKMFDLHEIRFEYKETKDFSIVCF